MFDDFVAFLETTYLLSSDAVPHDTATTAK